MTTLGVSIFQRYPKLTLCFTVGAAFLLIDLMAGILFIPDQHNDFRCYHDYYHHGMLPNREASRSAPRTDVCC